MGADLINGTATDEEKKEHYNNPVVLREILSKGDEVEGKPKPILCYEYCESFCSKKCFIKKLKKAQQNGFCSKKGFRLKIPIEGIGEFEAQLIKSLKECT